ncbi:MAG: hypothetical protein IPN98_16825 [Propionivibrio sp.]|nr:hypothetical protein [Propionivibrio sp.]
MWSVPLRVIDHQARSSLRMLRNNRGDLRGMNEDTCTSVVWSARPSHPLMRTLVRPLRLTPGVSMAERSPVAKRING